MILYNVNDLCTLTHIKKGVYLITHHSLKNLNYIGQSSNIYKRWKEHIKNPKRSGARLLSEAFIAHGVSTFSFCILEECLDKTIEELLICEEKWMRYYNSVEQGLNIAYNVNAIPTNLKSLGGIRTATKSRNGECHTFFNSERAKDANEKSRGSIKVWEITFPNGEILIGSGLYIFAEAINVNYKSLCNWASSAGSINYKSLRNFKIRNIHSNLADFLDKNKLYSHDEIKNLKLDKFLER